MQTDDMPFAPTPDRLSALTGAIMKADPAGALIAARQMSEGGVSDLPMAAMGIAAVLWALAAVVREVRPVAQPISDAVAKRIREAPEGREEAVDEAKKS